MAAFLTPRQVAERWTCSERQVERLCQTGKLRAMRPGARSWRIALADVEAFEARRLSAASAAPSSEPIRPVFGVLEETGAPLPLPERWWEQQTNLAASSAARRGGTARTKKRLPEAI